MSVQWNEAQDFVSLCKGARASVILLLLFAEGRSLTKEQICEGVRYSDKPVKSALDWLEPRGVVQYNGHFYGYSLSRGARQLDFVRQLVGLAQLPPPVSALAASSHDEAGEPAAPSHDGVVVPEFGDSSHGESQQTAMVVAEFGITPNEPRNNSEVGLQGRKVSEVEPHVCMFKHKQKAIKQKHTKHDKPEGRMNSELRFILQLVGVSGPNLDKLSKQDIPLSWPLAWWLDLQNQPWKPENAGGWIFMRLRDSTQPQSKYVKDAEFHLGGWKEGMILELPVLETSTASAVDVLIEQGVILR